MLVDLQALLALVPRDELDLRVGQPARGQIRQHLVAEQVRVDVVCDAGLPSVVLHDLLHAPGGERPVAPCLEEVGVLRVGSEMALEDQPEARREQDVAVLAALALVDEDSASLHVDIVDADAHQLAHSHGRIEE